MKKNIRVGLYGKRASQEQLGHFATEIYEALQAEAGTKVYKLDFDPAPNLDTVLYASRSADKLRQAAELCIKMNIPLLILSSDLKDQVDELPAECNVQVIPNSSLEVQEYQRNVINYHRAHPDQKVTITEYHQQSKLDVSGTAIAIAKQINFDSKNIISIRDDPTAQRLYNIPDQSKDAYAVHQIAFTNSQTNTTQMFEIKVCGRSTYISGLIEIVQKFFSD